MITLLFATAALAAPPTYPVTLSGGLGGAAGPPSFGGYGVGRAVLYPPRSAVGLELGGREGYFVDDQRTVGGLAVQAHVPLRNAYLRGGFLHHHEVPWEVVKGAPVESVLGSADGIRHRSGLEVGVGLDLPVTERMLGDRLGFALDLSIAAFPDDNGPPVYVFVEQAWTIDVGKGR